MKWPLYNLKHQVVGEVDLSDDIFAVPVRSDILARVVHWQRAKARSGNHQTKTISEVSGTTRKPFPQKGRGAARQGSLRSPQMRGGGCLHGPQKRSYDYPLPKKVRKLGLKVALSSKCVEGDLVVVDNLSIKEHKTKHLQEILMQNGWQSALFIDGAAVNEVFARASSNIVGVDVLPQQGANVLSILRRQKLILSQDAVHHLEARLK